MKTSLKVFSLFTTVSVPAALALEVAGVNLPPGLSVGSAFGLCVVSLLTLTVVSDYARAHQPRLVESLVDAKATHPLAA